jgi:outer membrane protein assembly factor BamB
MTIDDLVFVGLNGYVLAVHRETGDIVWSCDHFESGYSTLLLDGDRLIACTGGYLHCLDPLTGREFWSNPLRGYGMGVGAMISTRGQSATTIAQAAAADAARRRAAGGAAASSGS